jgi:uncharacterized protein YcaQ
MRSDELNTISLRLSAAAARAVMVAAQGLATRPRKAAGKADVLSAIRRMGTLQIDTIHVVARSPYLVLWSRLGAYDPRWLEELLAEGALFEYWAHEASFLPIEDYALYRHRMIDPGGLGWKYSHEWTMRNAAVMEHVLNRIREEGAVRSADFERRDGKKGGWWGWKPEKRALEMLFSRGEVMVARRERFQRVYDLRERVHPSWDDTQLPSHETMARALALKAVAALGVTRARWVSDYFRMPRRQTADVVRALGAEGALLPVQVAGWEDAGWVHPANLELIERAAEGKLRPKLVTFLSPFDPLVWDRERARTVFGFDYALECYTPAARRVYGYFTLPILRAGQLVGRMDAKAHRGERRFVVNVLHLEPNVKVTEALASDLSQALTECAAWHETPQVHVTRTVPSSFAAVLRRALRARQ